MRRMIFCCLLSFLILADSPAAFAVYTGKSFGVSAPRIGGSGFPGFSPGRGGPGGTPPGQAGSPPGQGGGVENPGQQNNPGNKAENVPFQGAPPSSGVGLNSQTETFTTAEQVLDKCKVENCDEAVKKFISSLPEEKRVEAGRALAISLANLGEAGGAAKNNYVAALKEVANQLVTRDQQLSNLIASISDNLSKGNTLNTGALQRASAN